jgi:hypothetical protein
MKDCFKNIFLQFFSVFLTCGFFFGAYLFFSGGVKTDDPNLLVLFGSVLGELRAMSGQVVAYWFGTSKSSTEKDKLIAEIGMGTGGGSAKPPPSP